jgi:peptidoglycan-N-acetylglucosamine deacetylase
MTRFEVPRQTRRDAERSVPARGRDLRAGRGHRNVIADLTTSFLEDSHQRMLKRRRIRLMVGILSVCLLLAVGTAGTLAQPAERRVAITIDDGPMLRFASQPTDLHRIRAVDAMISALHDHGAPATLFVVGQKLEDYPQAVPILERWLAAGVDVGNHTFSHGSIDALGAEAFLADIDRANDLLRPIVASTGREVRFFRAPYLLEGGTPERQAALADHLAREGMRNAPVTIAIEDWRHNDHYEAAEREGDLETRDRIGREYLAQAAQVIDDALDLGERVAGREIAHILLLHANTINRDYLVAILHELKDRGARFISLDEALADPIYSEPLPARARSGTLLIRLGEATGVLAPH